MCPRSQACTRGAAQHIVEPEAAERALGFLAALRLRAGASTINVITHTWEALLALFAVTDLGRHMDLDGFLRKAEEPILELRSHLGDAGPPPLPAIEYLEQLASTEGLLASLFRSDIWFSAQRRRALVDKADSGTAPQA